MRPRVMMGLALIAVLAFSCSQADERPTASSSRPTPWPSVLGIVDPKGDALVPEAIGYLDALSAHVSKSGGAFEFSFTLAEAVPASFDVPAGWDALFWSFCLDMDPRHAPIGYPFAFTTAAPCEFIIVARSTGGPITGVLIDRRPLVNADDAITVSIPITVSATEIRATVPASRLGRPRRLRWVMKTSEVTLPLGNDNFVDLEEVPDESFTRPGRWPADRL
jgi:hypothetical protein